MHVACKELEADTHHTFNRLDHTSSMHAARKQQGGRYTRTPNNICIRLDQAPSMRAARKKLEADARSYYQQHTRRAGANLNSREVQEEYAQIKLQVGSSRSRWLNLAQQPFLQVYRSLVCRCASVPPGADG
eukprot:1161042-Pelagomonas_calceolata.AAC.3